MEHRFVRLRLWGYVNGQQPEPSAKGKKQISIRASCAKEQPVTWCTPKRVCGHPCSGSESETTNSRICWSIGRLLCHCVNHDFTLILKECG